MPFDAGTSGSGTNPSGSGGGGSGGVVQASQAFGGWDAHQVRMARIIINVGAQMNMSHRDIQIALMTAIQESTLRNLRYGDRDSQGLFQQRPSQGWGTVAQVTDPQYAARKFYSVLKTIKGRDNMRMTLAAQAVQRSAYPYAYADHRDEARNILNKLGFGGGGGGGGGNGFGPSQQPTQAFESALWQAQASSIEDIAETMEDNLRSSTASIEPLGLAAADAPMDFSEVGSASQLPLVQDELNALQNLQMPQQQGGGGGGGGGFSGGAANGWRGRVEKIARNFLGVPYVWGGTSPQGFDCSGFVQYVYNKMGKSLPRISADQARAGTRINDLSNLKPGDLVAWDNSSRNVGADHISIYIGNGMVIHAPRPGQNVQIDKIWDPGQAWGVRMKL